MLEDLLEGVSLVSEAYNNTIPDGYEVLYKFSDTMGFILKKNNILYIVYRGTENQTDVLTDADILSVRVYGGRVHKGAWYKYMQFIQLALYEVENTDATEIRIYGHSMGAWLATLNASTVASKKPKVYLYASPKLGDLEYVDYFKSLNLEVHSFCSKHDIVPDVPVEFYQIIEPVKIDFPGVFPLDELENHKLENFIPALKNYFNTADNL